VLSRYTITYQSLIQVSYSILALRNLAARVLSAVSYSIFAFRNLAAGVLSGTGSSASHRGKIW
jgi:hypothetical protein